MLCEGKDIILFQHSLQVSHTHAGKEASNEAILYLPIWCMHKLQLLLYISCILLIEHYNGVSIHLMQGPFTKKQAHQRL